MLLFPSKLAHAHFRSRFNITSIFIFNRLQDKSSEIVSSSMHINQDKWIVYFMILFVWHDLLVNLILACRRRFNVPCVAIWDRSTSIRLTRPTHGALTTRKALLMHFPNPESRKGSCSQTSSGRLTCICSLYGYIWDLGVIIKCSINSYSSTCHSLWWWVDVNYDVFMTITWNANVRTFYRWWSSSQFLLLQPKTKAEMMRGLLLAT